MYARIPRQAGTSSGALRGFLHWVRGVLGGRPPPDPTVVHAPDAIEDTGVWGVGGPAMREPGSTGILRALEAPREDPGD